MRTTVDVDAALLERAKRLGSKQGRTLSAVVNEALAAYLGAHARKDVSKEPPFELIVRGTPGARFPTAAEFSAAEEDDDRESLQIPGGKRRATP